MSEDGCGREMGAENCADGWVQTDWLKMGRGKKPLVMSELGCADGSGRQMGGENCADGCGRRGCEGVAGNGWGEKKADGKWVRRIARTAKMQPTNPNAHTYVNGYAVTQNNFLQ